MKGSDQGTSSLTLMIVPDHSQVARVAVFIVATIGFSLFLAVKDLLFRYLAISGWTSSHILVVSGIGCLMTTLIVSLTCFLLGERAAFRVNDMRLQAVRLCVAGLSSFFVARAFQHLHATSVAMISKVYIPLLLLSAPLIGVSYSKKQKILAMLSIFAISGFALIARDQNELAIGYVEVVLAVLFVMLEYILLRKAVFSETLFWIAFTPALSCLLYGMVGLGLTGFSSIVLLDTTRFVFGFTAGICLYFLYVISKYRYRILPIGISEYPSLVSALVILPAEYFLFGWRADLKYVTCLATTLFFMVLTVYFRDTSHLSGRRKLS